MVQADFMLTVLVAEIIQYSLLRSSGTHCRGHPVLVTEVIWYPFITLNRYQLVWMCASDTDCYTHPVLTCMLVCVQYPFFTPVWYQYYAAMCVRYLFLIPRLGCWNEIVLDEFNPFCWFKHSLFIGSHDTFHHSCTLCHANGIISLRIDVSSNCNKSTNIWCYL